MSKSGSKKKTKKPRRSKPYVGKAALTRKGSKRIDVSIDELKSILERTKLGPLTEQDRVKLGGAVDTLAVVTSELESKSASIRRLQQLIFGSSSEKTRDVLGKLNDEPAQEEKDPSVKRDSDETEVSGSERASSGPDADTSAENTNGPTGEKKRKGHGRNGASEYKGADKVKVPHESLKNKDRCPECKKGKLYRQNKPAVLVRVHGVAPLKATVYELERLRCNLCDEVFTASAPEGLGDEKYDETSAAMIALLKYGCGLPFNRLERLEGNLGIPLPASTQWEVVEPAAVLLAPIFWELIRQGAQGEVLHNDDTTARILELYDTKDSSDAESEKRTGVFTSGIVSVKGGRRMALFFTGRQHAGENLADVLKHRADELEAPIQMSDGLSANKAGDFESHEAECNAHAKRRFVEQVDNYPDEVAHVLEIYKQIYKNEDETHSHGMTPEERLAYHQKHSKPLMDDLEVWLKAQFDERLIEPNSLLGAAIKYMQNHWKKLTLFLRKEGAPIDNNICERALKKTILHRKNALFFKTENGAQVGDLFMSLIHTCELEGVSAFDYLVALLKNHEATIQDPSRWLPWNYKEALAELVTSTESVE